MATTGQFTAGRFELAIDGHSMAVFSELQGITTELRPVYLLLVEGNPLENLDLVADPANNFKIIMKDGVVYKNTLTE